MNKGDTITIILDYNLDGNPLQKDAYDEIEFTIGEQVYTLSNGKITWNEEEGKYLIDLSQEETFNLPNIVKYQVRIKYSGDVTSSDVETLRIGNTISKVVL